MSEQFNEIFGGPGSGGGGSSSSGTIGTIVIGIVSSETDLNTLYPATDPKYKDGTFAIVDNLTERKIFFVKSQTWLWSEEFTQAQIDALFTLVNDLKSGFKRLGTFNPKTNTPPLPLTPSNASLDAGDYYEIAGLDAGEEFTWNSLILTNKDWIIVEKDGSDAVLKWEKRNYGVIAKDIFYDNTTSGATSTNLQDLGDELALKIDDLQGKLVYNYFVDNTAGLNAITGMTANEYAIQRDTQTVYKYSGTAWEQYDYNKSEVDNLLDDKVDKINTTAQSNIGSASKTATITINTEGQVTALTEQDIAISSNQVSQAIITPTSGIYANGDTQEQINNKGQGQINEAFARIVTVENRPVGNSGEGKRYFISTPATAGIYSATEIFTESPTTITKTFTPISTYQTVFEAETQALNITAIPSGGWNTDISFTHTHDKDFTAKVSFYNGATLLGEIESVVLPGNEKIVLSKTFPTFAFTSGNKLKFKLEAKSDHNGSISVFTNDGTNDLHIHTPVLIDVVNSAVQSELNLKQDKTLVVANQTAMLALTGVEVGQEVIRQDDNFYKYYLKALPASILTNWQVIGKDTPPIGETVEDIITNNEVITSKIDGLYAFAAIPNGGLPVGVARGDIAQKTGSSWTVIFTFANAPASIFAKSDGKVYNKKVDGSNNPTWFILPDPTFYEVGSGKEYATLQSAIDTYATSGKPLGVINVFDQTIAENVTINASTQNLLIQGFGTFGRANTQVSKLTILGHRVTLNTLQVNELEINSAGTITENGVPNIGRGKHIFDKVTFANATTAFTVTAINNFLSFYSCDFSSKIISIANHTGTPTTVTINNCQNGILNLGSNRFVIKAYSPSIYRGTITGTIIDLDNATPVAYSILRTYSALGLSIPVALGAMIINDDDVSVNYLANLKCTTAYTIAAALGVGTPIDLTKYDAPPVVVSPATTDISANALQSFAGTKSNALYPSYNDILFQGTERLVGTFAELTTALTNSINGDVILLTADITLTAKLVINKRIYLNSSGGIPRSLQTTADTVGIAAMIDITVSGVVIGQNCHIKHKKTNAGSSDYAISISADNVCILSSYLEYKEFGIILNGSASILIDKIEYTGLESNSNRAIAIYKTSNNTATQIICNNFEFTYTGATPRTNFVLISSNSVPLQTFDGHLYVKCKQGTLTKIMRQFVFFEVLNKTAGAKPSLIVDSSEFNALNGDVGVILDANNLSFFDYIAVYNNTSGNAAFNAGNYKGLFFIDKLTAGVVSSGETNFYFNQNICKQVVRAANDYTTIFTENNGSIFAYNNLLITQSTNLVQGNNADILLTQNLLKFINTTREDVANKVSTFTATPNNTNYITEKLAKDSLDLKQNITDNTLNTTSKTIVGGINELKTSIDGKVVDAINDGVTSSAPSQNAVFDALALKANQSTTYTKTETDTALDLKQKKVYDYTDTEANILLINPTANNGKTAKATDTLKEYISNGTAWEEVGGGTADGSRVIKTLTQNAHGFSVGKLLALNNSGVYILADNRDLLQLCCVGFVDSVVDVNTFVLGTNGYFTTFTGLASGQPHFVGINGNVTVTPPTSIGTYKQMVLHAVNATEAHFFNSNEPIAPSTSFPLNPFIVGEIKYLDEVADFTTIFGRWLLRNGRAISRTTYSENFAKATVQFTGNITNGLNTITNVADTTQFAEGRAIEGVGIPAGATIASITTNTITLQTGQNATATTTGVSLRYFKYGNGDGSTTYNIEDARGRVDGAIGQGAGLTNRKAGDIVGTQTETLTEAQIPANVFVNRSTGALEAGGLAFVSTLNAGGGQPHNNMQPTIFSKNSFVFVGTN